jgi:peptide/nickel transport system substrate-binding protein
MAIGHGGAESEEERREMVYEALDIMGQDGGIIPYSTSAEFSVVNTDYLNPQGVGSVGFLSVNVNSFAKTELEQGDKIISQASVLLSEDVVWHESNHSNVIVVGSNFFHSPLIGLDENGEAEPVLAESWEERESGTVIEFSLFEDAVFHNGDQITSEDVKFTWDLMQKWADHVNKYSRMEALESIEAPDDRTVIFNFSDPYRPFMGKEIFKWGILHKPSWEEAMEVGIRDFEWESPKIGSGPYKYEHWELGDDFIAGSPHEDHPSKVPNHPFEFQLFREPTTALQAFTNEEIHAMQSIAFGITQRAIDQLGDPAQRISGLAVLASPVYIHWAFGPGKFVPFRKAVGTGINRERIYEVEFGGELEPHMAASIFTSEHPWSLPEDRMQDIKFTDDPSGDIDAARAKLQDAGFGWDDEGRLHYPPDADLSPRWPQGEIPSPEYGFNCLDSDSNWVPPEQR